MIPPQRIADRFELQDLLGRGGMGSGANPKGIGEIVSASQ